MIPQLGLENLSISRVESRDLISRSGYTVSMSTWVWVFAILAGLLLLVQRRAMKRRYRSLAGEVTVESEACHKECADLLR